MMAITFTGGEQVGFGLIKVPKLRVRSSPDTATSDNIVGLVYGNTTYIVEWEEQDPYQPFVAVRFHSLDEEQTVTIIEGWTHSDYVTFIPTTMQPYNVVPSRFVDFPLLPTIPTLALTQKEREALATLLYWLRIYVEADTDMEGNLLNEQPIVDVRMPEFVQGMAILEAAVAWGRKALTDEKYNIIDAPKEPYVNANE